VYLTIIIMFLGNPLRNSMELN